MAGNGNEGRVRRGRKAGDHAQAPSVHVLDRAVLLLSLVAERDASSLSEIAERAGMAVSTTHRLLSSLASHGMTAVDPDTGQWTIGVRAFEIGNGFLRYRKFGTIGRPFLKALMEESGETANLAIEDAGELVFVSQIESHAAMRAFFRPGRRAPLYASGIGKAILSTWSDVAIGRAVGGRLERFTANTLSTLPAVLADIQQIRGRGWSVDDEEHTLGMRCIAAAVFNEHGEAVAGISVSGPTVRLPKEAVTTLGPLVRGTADRLTAAIGGRRPAELQAQ
jgi:IclR family acetate operon transcriptional repressor